MKFKDAKTKLKDAGVKFRDAGDWKIDITQKNLNQENVQKFMRTCRDLDLSHWHIKFPDDGSKDPIHIWWN